MALVYPQKKMKTDRKIRGKSPDYRNNVSIFFLPLPKDTGKKMKEEKKDGEESRDRVLPVFLLQRMFQILEGKRVSIHELIGWLSRMGQLDWTVPIVH